VPRRADLDIQLNILREAGNGEITGPNEGDGADDGNARMSNAGFCVEFPFGVNATLDFALLHGLHYRGRAAQQVVGLLLTFEAVVELLAHVLAQSFKNRLPGASCGLATHEDAD